MTHEEILREISSLPPEGRRMVEDFVAFLRQRYSHTDVAAVETKNPDLRDEAFVGMWRDREEMQESGAWVRRLRESEWVK